VRKIRKSNAKVVTLAGTGSAGFLNGTGVLAMFNNPTGISLLNNEILICDKNNNRIRMISNAGLVSTIAGNSQSGSTNGSGTDSRFNQPGGIARNSDGDFFITDTGNHCIRKVVID
jgi:hypothetical protein